MDHKTEDDRERRAEKPKFMFMGRNMANMPCFRNSLLGGISSGIGAGILTFMFTSKTTLATHTAVGTVSVVTLTYFAVCRYQFAREARLAMQVKSLMHEVLEAEGPDQHEKMRKLETLIDT